MLFPVSDSVAIEVPRLGPLKSLCMLSISSVANFLIKTVISYGSLAATGANDRLLH